MLFNLVETLDSSLQISQSKEKSPKVTTAFCLNVEGILGVLIFTEQEQNAKARNIIKKKRLMNFFTQSVLYSNSDIKALKTDSISSTVIPLTESSSAQISPHLPWIYTPALAASNAVSP